MTAALVMRAHLTCLVTFSSWRRNVASGRKAPEMPSSFSLLVVGKVRVIAAFVCGEDIASRVCIRVNVPQTLCVCLPATCLYACPPDVYSCISFTKLF
jgi:hypothetical protein